MDITCTNYEISIPSDGSERMVSFSSYDVLNAGAAGGDPVSLDVFQDGMRAKLQDGTQVWFPALPAELHQQMTKHPTAWVCALAESGKNIELRWGGCVPVNVVDQSLDAARGA